MAGVAEHIWAAGGWRGTIVQRGVRHGFECECPDAVQQPVPYRMATARISSPRRSLVSYTPVAASTDRMVARQLPLPLGALLGEARKLFPAEQNIIGTFDEIEPTDPKDPGDKSKVLQEIHIEINQLITLLGNDQTLTYQNVLRARLLGIEGFVGWASPEGASTRGSSGRPRHAARPG